MVGVHASGSFLTWFEIAAAILVVLTLLLREGSEPGPGGIRQLLSSKRVRITVIVLSADLLLLAMKVLRPHGLF